MAYPDFLKHCPTCLWCCRGENLYVAPDEPAAREFTEPRQGEDCPKLDPTTGLCTIHPIRPIECQLFPLDILLVDEVPTWVLWETPCPAVHTPPRRAYWWYQAAAWEATLSEDWIRAYVEHHREHQPMKYGLWPAKVIRQVQVGVSGRMAK